MWTDTHIHLADSRYAQDLDDVLARARRAEVKAFLLVACEEEEFDRALTLAEAHEDIRLALGFHPHVASEVGEGSWNRLIDTLQHPAVVAVGECGLDYHYMNSPKDAQRECFARHIALAQRAELPLVLHSREADEDMCEILQSHECDGGGCPLTGVFHCFPGSAVIRDLAERLGFYLGVGGVLTFKKAQELRDTMARWPLDRTLLETDGPYLTPEPYRGKRRRNEPLHIPIIGQRLAQVKGVTEEEAARVTTSACHRLLGWPAPAPALPPG